MGAHCDYSAQQDTELSFRAGEKLELLPELDECPPGWRYATNAEQQTELVQLAVLCDGGMHHVLPPHSDDSALAWAARSDTVSGPPSAAIHLYFGSIYIFDIRYLITSPKTNVNDTCVGQASKVDTTTYLQ